MVGMERWKIKYENSSEIDFKWAIVLHSTIILAIQRFYRIHGDKKIIEIKKITK